IGRALYDRLLPLLRAQGFATLLAGITQPNDASVALHEAFGFRRCAMLTRVGFKNGAWRNVGIWELHVSDAPPGARKTLAECWSAPCPPLLRANALVFFALGLVIFQVGGPHRARAELRADLVQRCVELVGARRALLLEQPELLAATAEVLRRDAGEPNRLAQ